MNSHWVLIHMLHWHDKTRYWFTFCITGPLWGNPLETGGFPSQRDSSGELCCFLYYPFEQTVKETVKLPVIWDVIVLMWHHPNGFQMKHELKSFSCFTLWYVYREHFVYVPSQWEATLQCNVVSHWLGTCTKWSLCVEHYTDSHHVQSYTINPQQLKAYELWTPSRVWCRDVNTLAPGNPLTLWPLDNVIGISIFRHFIVIDNMGIS